MCQVIDFLRIDKKSLKFICNLAFFFILEELVSIKIFSTTNKID